MDSDDDDQPTTCSRRRRRVVVIDSITALPVTYVIAMSQLSSIPHDLLTLPAALSNDIMQQHSRDPSAPRLLLRQSSHVQRWITEKIEGNK